MFRRHPLTAPPHSFSTSPITRQPSQPLAAVNIYYTTRSLMTKLDHPTKGDNQLWRSAVYNTEQELRALLLDPRLHTGKGYRAAENATRGCVQCGEMKLRRRVSPPVPPSLL